MKKTEKKRLSGLLVGILALALLAGCGSGGETETQSPETTPETSNSTVDPEAEAGWYELDGETGVLTVRIPDETPDFDWCFVIGDESVVELLTEETTEDVWVASFRALADGESQITFSYVKNDEVNEGRLLEVLCEDGKVADVTSDSVIDMTGAGESAEPTSET